MDMEEELANDLEIVDIKRHHEKIRPENKQKDGMPRNSKVKVVFGEMHERDVVLSHASLLKKGFGIDIVIPEFLAPLKRHLESFAYRIRKNAKDTGKD